MTDGESRVLVERALQLQQQGAPREAEQLLEQAMQKADIAGLAADRVATRLMLADALGATDIERSRRLLTEAFAIAEEVHDLFGMGSSAIQLAELISETSPPEPIAWLRRARACFASAGRSEDLASVLLRLIADEPDEGRAQEAFSELSDLADAIPDRRAGILGTANTGWGERLLVAGQIEDALPFLVAAHEFSIRALDGIGAVAAGLRLNAVLGRLHDAWQHLPDGSGLAERFGVPALAMAAPSDGSEVMIGWDFDPRNLPFTARHFPPVDSRNGWVLWTGAEPVAYPGYVPITAGELVRWLPQVARYLELPPGWSFQIAPNHEDVWEEPELLVDDDQET